ncbi:Calsyntenin-1 [Orchesella cincta]|uniref:Calsyntenin-1 n=1 Tax=Orchesella cincta TaxID=48709 RepID=A0A1D2N0X2_ORCCI|nr:Calsyntenin-1 [Orchesella cincta]
MVFERPRQFSGEHVSASALKKRKRVPRLELSDPEVGYHGLIRENELVVEVKPKIRAVGAEICGFRILNRHHGESPFEIAAKAIAIEYRLKYAVDNRKKGKTSFAPGHSI